MNGCGLVHWSIHESIHWSIHESTHHQRVYVHVNCAVPCEEAGLPPPPLPALAAAGVTAAAIAPPLPKLRLRLDASGLLRVPLPAGVGRWRINGDGELEISTTTTITATNQGVGLSAAAAGGGGPAEGSPGWTNESRTTDSSPSGGGEVRARHVVSMIGGDGDGEEGGFAGISILPPSPRDAVIEARPSTPPPQPLRRMPGGKRMFPAATAACAIDDGDVDDFEEDEAARYSVCLVRESVSADGRDTGRINSRRREAAAAAAEAAAAAAAAAALTRRERKKEKDAERRMLRSSHGISGVSRPTVWNVGGCG